MALSEADIASILNGCPPTIAIAKPMRGDNFILRSNDKVIYDDLIFCKYLRSQRYFDVVTYTASPRAFSNCRRLLACKLNEEPWPYSQTEVRLLQQVHSKVYFLPHDEVWVGSMNLVTSDKGWHNIMIRVPSNIAAPLRLYFDTLWIQATPI